MVGAGYLIEGIIYNILSCYQYYPRFLDHDPIYDSNLGAIGSNALSLPATATFIAAFRKNWIWIIAITGCFVGIEWLFVHLSIYSHNWWRYEFTAFGLLFVYFPFAKKLHQWLVHPQKGILHSFLLFLMIGPITGNMHILPIMFISNRYYELGWFDSLSKDTTALSAIYYVSSSLLITVLSIFHSKYKWLKYILLFIFTLGATMFLTINGILHSLKWWDPYYYLLFPLFVLKISVTISKRLSFGPS